MDVKEMLSDYLEELDHDRVEKGNRLYNKKGKQIVVKKLSANSAILTVPSESSQQQYTVTFIFDHKNLFVLEECECHAFEEFGECKHCVSAALYLTHNNTDSDVKPVEELKINAGKNADKEVNPEKIVIPFNTISYYEVNQLTRRYYGWNNYSNERKCKLIKVEQSGHLFSFTEAANKIYNQEIAFFQPNKLRLYCSCGKAKKNDLCLHLFTALGILRNKYGDFYFNRFKDYTNGKNELLSSYGLSLQDAEAKDFEFGFDYHGDLVLKKAPSYLVKINDEKSLSALVRHLIQPVAAQSIERPALPAGKFINFDLGYLFNFSVKQHINIFLLQ